MEFCVANKEDGLLEELLELREMEVFTNQDLAFINAWNPLDYNLTFPITNTCFGDHIQPLDQTPSYPSFEDELSPPLFTLDSSTLNPENQTLPNYVQQDYHYSTPTPFLDDAALFKNGSQNPDTGVPELAGFDPKSKVKKLNGQPSKNLMAERRRRKRLNERLSLLRSVVPKISKMDRTSILGDTIDYMKELLDRIKNLQEEMQLGSNEHQLGLGLLKDEINLLRNTPKFWVERRNELEARMEIRCAGKPGMLVSTVTTLEAFGLEIQQCVISCFNDFALQASCSQPQDLRKREILESEDIKQALVRNAGYGGRCL